MSDDRKAQLLDRLGQLSTENLEALVEVLDAATEGGDGWLSCDTNGVLKNHAIEAGVQKLGRRQG